MGIFPFIEAEKYLQANDKTRINLSKSFVSKDEAAITNVEIKPSLSDSFVSVYDEDETQWFLDWSYAGDTTRVETITARITTDGLPIELTKDINIISKEDDKLFSNDQDLLIHEPYIKNWVTEGRNTFLDVHRKSQYKILDYLDQNGYRLFNGDKIEKQHLLDIEEVREWSTFLTIFIITKGRSNAIGDVFDNISKQYKSYADRSRERVFRSVDWNKTGELDQSEKNYRTNVISVERT